MAHVTALNRLYQTELATPGIVRHLPATLPNSSDAGTSTSNASSESTGFAALFNGQTTSSTSTSSTSLTGAAAASASPPTPESVFGADPWEADPVGEGPNGTQFGYNPIYFATPQAAAQVAQMLGGTVVAEDEFAPATANDPYQQEQPNLMVQLPDGALINAGVIASFYTHGYSQSMVNSMIANEVNGATASGD